jgi:hypothetical protein
MTEEKKNIELKERDNKDPDIILIEPIESIFIDGFQGISITNGTVRINLHEDKYDPVTEKVNRHIVKRICLSQGSFISFIDTLNQVKNSMVAGIEDSHKEDIK